MAIGNEHEEKRRALAVIWQDLNWKSLRDARLIVALGPRAGLGLVTLYHDDWTLALGVPTSEHDVYLPGGPPVVDGQCHPQCRSGTGTHCFDGWIWGGATEAYDMCLDYFGLGPALFACWPPDKAVPRPVRAVGWACKKACDLLCAVLDLVEDEVDVEDLRPALKRAHAWLTVAAVCRLANQARQLDPNDCGHPACEPRRPCKYPEEITR